MIVVTISGASRAVAMHGAYPWGKIARKGPQEVKKERGVGFAWQHHLRKALPFSIWIALGGALKRSTGERRRQDTTSERCSATHPVEV